MNAPPVHLFALKQKRDVREINQSLMNLWDEPLVRDYPFALVYSDRVPPE